MRLCRGTSGVFVGIAAVGVMVVCGRGDSSADRSDRVAERLMEAVGASQVGPSEGSTAFVATSLAELVATSEAVVLGEVKDASVDEGQDPLTPVRFGVEVIEVVYEPVSLIGTRDRLDYYNGTVVDDLGNLFEGVQPTIAPGQVAYLFVTTGSSGRIHAVDPNSQIVVDDVELVSDGAEFPLGRSLSELPDEELRKQLVDAVRLVDSGLQEPAVDPSE